MTRSSRSSVPGYITNSHLYANMTLVNGQLVPLMGRPAPVFPDRSARVPSSSVESPSASQPSRCAQTVAASTSVSTAINQQYRPLTRYHSSQTVWLTGVICDPEVPRQISEGASSQLSPARLEIPKSMGFWEQSKE